MKRRKPLSAVSQRHLRRLSMKDSQDTLNNVLNVDKSNCSDNLEIQKFDYNCQSEGNDLLNFSSRPNQINTNVNGSNSESGNTCGDEADHDSDTCISDVDVLDDEGYVLSSSDFSDSELDSDIELCDDVVDSDLNVVSSEANQEAGCSGNNADTVQKTVSLKDDLTSWAIKHGITLSALSDLLKTLKEHGHSELPKDARTLLKTPRSVILHKISPGDYWHAGVEKGILLILSKEGLKNLNTIELAINVDGLPLSNSSNSSLWPILGIVLPSKSVFVIGLYNGITKPADPNEFFQDFVSEMEILSRTGVFFKDKLLNIKIKYFVFDAPAKSFALKIKGHGGYSSCTKCTVDGENVENRMCFTDLNSPKRTDESFRQRVDQEFHMGESSSVLLNIPDVGLVTNVPLDYMHLVCLGVVRKLLYLWLGGGKKTRLQSRDVKVVSDNLESLKKCVPKEFVRKPRSLTYVKQWKATELRQFLLYSGSVVLCKVLSKEIYVHFLTLSVAIRILCSEVHHSKYSDYAEYLLRKFVHKFSSLYGEHHVSHNVHGLIHIVDDVRNFGVLDNFSAFPFENYMQTLKKLVRKSEKPVQQLCKRYTEIKNSLPLQETCRCSTSHCSNNLMSPHYDGPLTDECQSNLQFKKTMIYKKCVLDVTSDGDNCCIVTDGSVVIVKNITFSKEKAANVIVGLAFRKKEDFFTKPCPSSLFDIFVVSQLSKNFKCWAISEVKSKCAIFPKETKFVVFPLLHSEH